MTIQDTVMNYGTSTYWLSKALKSALERDPVDALNDAEALVEILRERLERIYRHLEDI